MGLISKIGTKAVQIGEKVYAKGATVAGKAAGKAKVTRYEHGIPIDRYLKSGTEVMTWEGGKVVMPGANTKLGQMGVESVTSFAPEALGFNTQRLLSFKFKGAEKPMPLMDTKEAKRFIKEYPEFLALLKQAQKEGANKINCFG